MNEPQDLSSYKGSKPERKSSHQLVLLLGSNIGDRKAYLKNAIALLKDIGDLLKQSKVYRTKAWGNIYQEDFFNMAVILETKKTATEVLTEIVAIEKQLGRTRSELQYQPRTIDIDILFYDDLIMNTPDLTIPHPYISSRRFTLLPLADILPGFIHPVIKKEIRTLLQECKDKLDCEDIGTL
jgi:2-amino-4-hydroxy-6-hydroxymethyldihydropteridine diphosphokinase